MEDSLSPWERGGVRVVPQPDAGPPEHWMQRVRSTRRGPPADWVERVRRGAPHLLEGLELEEAPVKPPRREPMSVMGSVPAPPPRPRVPLSSPPPPGREMPGRVPLMRPSVPQTPVSVAPAVVHSVVHSVMHSAPAPVRSSGPRTGASVPRPPPEREATALVSGIARLDARTAPREGGSIPSALRMGPQREAGSTRTRGLSFRPLPETSSSPESQRFMPLPGTRSVQQEGNPGPQSFTPSPCPSPRGRGVMGSVMAPGLAVGAASLPPTRSSSFPMPEPSVPETSRPRATARSAPSSAPGMAFSSEEALPAWPEPPELPSPEPGDPLVVLRHWERLRRLEREQRGE